MFSRSYKIYKCFKLCIWLNELGKKTFSDLLNKLYKYESFLLYARGIFQHQVDKGSLEHVPKGTNDDPIFRGYFVRVSDE